MKNPIWAVGLGAALGALTGTAAAEYRFTAPGGQSIAFTGYVREHLAVNLQDKVEPDASGTDRIGGAGEISMLRSTFRLETRADLGFAQVSTVYRFDREHETGYLDDLNDTVAAGNAAYGPFAPRHNWMDDIEGDQMREWFVGFDVGSRARVVLGKQQVVWGETDFLRAMDIIHGFDLRWRSFLETENEELRKPLIMANVVVQVPELSGEMQFLVRPGWDEDKELGNNVDLRGGRWSGQPTHGVDFIPLLPFNYDHARADADDVNWGLRWSGDLASWGYSLNYWRGLNVDPVVNSVFAPWGGFPKLSGNPAQLGELIYPKVETFGATANGYLEAVDSVIRLELAFTPDKPYNVGTDFGLPVGPGATLWVPGLGGIVEKNTLVSMVGVDKQLPALQGPLRTNKFPLLSVQVFDTWLTNFKRSDDIVDILGYGAAKREHTTIFSALLALNYRYETVNPSIAALVDVQNGDFAMIPALDLVLGDHWRIHTDMNLFFPRHRRDVKRTPFGLFAEDTFDAKAEDETHLLGTFANNSQFNLRVTYQF